MSVTAGVILIVATAAMFATGGCRRPGTAETPTTDGEAAPRDEIGRRVVPRRTPARRIVSLAPSVTEILFAIGAGESLVGIDNFSDHPADRVRAIRRIGSNLEPSVETIVALNPDVVITAMSANRQQTVEALERLGIPCFVTDTRRAADLPGTFRRLGALAGHADGAEREIARIQAALARVRSQAQGRPAVRTLIAIWREPLFVAGRDTFTQDLLEIAGGVNVASDVAGFVRYPVERLLKSQVDVIIMPTHAPEDRGREQAASWQVWPVLPAVRSGRIHAVQDALLIRPGPRVADAAEMLFAVLHRGSNAPDVRSGRALGEVDTTGGPP